MNDAIFRGLRIKGESTYADRVGTGGLPLADGRGLLLSEGRGFLLSEGRGAGEPDGGGGRPLTDGRGGRADGRGALDGGGRTLSLGLGTPEGRAVGLGLSCA